MVGLYSLVEVNELDGILRGLEVLPGVVYENVETAVLGVDVIPELDDAIDVGDFHAVKLGILCLGANL